ncbi:MAG TPA: glycosyltransferase family 4 protein [Burkholderiales bacterium]
MKICLVGLDNLPVLAPEYRQHAIGGESVQQTLLARALARRGHEVSMVAADYGQADGAAWGAVRVFKAYRPAAGIPVLRFIHPRWTGLWSALARADADLYYTSCAGMHVGLVAMFCSRHRRRFVFRTASDTDCDPSRLLVEYARDRRLYAYGLQRADAVLVQSHAQALALARNFRLQGRIAGMLVEAPPPAATRAIDVLWVSNIRRVKRPDLALALAAQLPETTMHMVGGSLPGEEALYEEARSIAAASPNVTFHGRLPYWDANMLYDRARLLVNTSDVEGFPNSYLQAWVRGVPVIAFLDPDGIIRERGLGVAVDSPLRMRHAIRQLLGDPAALAAAGNRCRQFMAREFSEDKVLAPYLAAFEGAQRHSAPGSRMILPDGARHV